MAFRVDRTTWRALGGVLALVLLAAVVGWLRGGGTTTATDPGSSYQAIATPTGSAATAGEGTDPESGLPWVDVADLPAQARQTLELIDAGGPFPYPDKDGSTFGNYEGLLPQHPRGYYAEYTVPTPGEDDRGARRIIVGDGGEYYWTPDHYATFRRIRR